MSSTECVLASAAEPVREFSRYSDVALSQPVVVTQEGVPRNILISYAEYERLIGRDIQAFRAADTPDEVLDDLTQLASADHLIGARPSFADLLLGFPDVGGIQRDPAPSRRRGSSPSSRGPLATTKK